MLNTIAWGRPPPIRGGLRGGLWVAGWVVGCVAERVAEGGGDVVSYLVHWSRAARPKLLQHRGCHKAAVMTEFTATALRFRRSKTLAACGDAVGRHDLHKRLRVSHRLLLALAGLRNGAKAMPLGSESTV